MRKVVSSNPGTAEEEEEEEGEEGEENKSFKDKEQGIIVHIHLGGGKRIARSSWPAWATKEVLDQSGYRERLCS